MVDGDIAGKGKRVPSLDVDNGSTGTRAAAGVAAQVVIRQAGNWRVVVCILADMLVHAERPGPDAELLENVVSRRDIDDAKSDGGEERGEFHTC